MNTTKQAVAILMASTFLSAGHASAQTGQQTQTQTQTKPPATSTTRPDVPVAGRSTVGVTVIEMDAIIAGWSVKNDLLRKAVVNENKEKIGSITDIIISSNPDAKLPAASFAIIGAGGFLGLGKHDVAIPMEQIKVQDGALVLRGATKETLKALPQFEYRKK